MQKNLPNWAFGVLSVVGVVLVGSMVLNWIDFGGEFTVRGYSLAFDNKWLLLVPVAGAALIAAASTRSQHARLAAIFAGVVVTGYVLFGLTRSIVHSGLDTWLMLGGAGAMLAGVSKERAWLRAAGGAAVLAGFFAPWAELSMAGTLWHGYVGGLIGKSLWLIPLAGIAGIISFGSFGSFGSAQRGAGLAAAAGITVYGTFLLVLGSTALLVFGLGAWLAVGASTVALVIGVLARSPAEAVPAAKALPASL